MPPPPQHESGGDRRAPVPDRGDPGRPRLDAPQVRRPRRRLGLDRLDELDRRLVDARGERHPHGRLARRSRRATSRTSSSSGRRATSRAAAASTRRPVDGMRAWFCPGRGEKLAHRIAKAIGSARRRVRIASPVISSAPILAHARAGRLRREGRPRRRRRRHPGRRGAPAVAREQERRLEGAAAAHGADARAVLGQGHDAVRARARCTTTCTRR